MKKRIIAARVLFAAALFLLAASAVFAQDDDTNSRSITSKDFQAQRQGGEKTGAGMKSTGAQATKTTTTSKSTNAVRKKNLAVITNSKRRYNLVKKIPSKTSVSVSTNIGAGKTTVTTNGKIDAGKVNVTTKNLPKTFKNEELGVTFWRLRPKNADDDDAPTFQVKSNNQIENWTAERVSSTTKFRKGDKVRFTIESSRSGYIYIVNREFYADGTTGQAEIIFPTLRTRSEGDNRVRAGSLIEIPGSEVAFPYFNVNPKRDDYIGEELLVLIMPEKLPLEIGTRALAIREEIVRQWLSDWSSEVEIFDAADGEGVAITQAEAAAATTNSRSLTQEEPLPQTIYRVRIDTNTPLVVPFQMQAAKP
jgi:hypothetical protein